MSTLVFQVHILQWEKSQQSDLDFAKRSEIKTAYSINNKPEFFILNMPCIIDRHGQTYENKKSNDAITRKLKTTMLKDGTVVLERFLIKEVSGSIVLSYQNSKGDIETLGELNKGWLCATYTSRRSVEQDSQIFWMYEKITLNAALIEDDISINKDYFLSNSPQYRAVLED